MKLEELLERDDIVEGVHYYLIGDRVFPIVQGGAVGDDDDDEDEQEDEGSESEEDEDEESEEEDPDEKKFSQKDVNRIMSKEKKDGRRIGRKAILEELGVSSVEEAKKKIAAATKAKAKPKLDDDDDTEEDSSEQEPDRTMDRLEARAERLLIRAGAPDSDKKLAGLIRMLDLDPSMDQDDVTSAVEELKEEMPALFDTTDKGSRQGKTPRSDAGPGRRKTKVAPKNAANSLMERRHGKASS